VASLGAVEFDRTGSEGTVDVKSFGHPCYNSWPPPTGHGSARFDGRNR
jgi:hypothetical protein